MLTPMLDDALRALDDDELAVLTKEFHAKAHAAAQRRPRISNLFHALAVCLAEESDRRDELLEALDAEVDDTDEGEIVAPPS